MPRLRMATGIVATGLNCMRGPTAALLRFVHTVVCGLLNALLAGVKAGARIFAVIFPWLAAVVAIALLACLAYMLVRQNLDARSLATEATKHEIAFNESLEASAKSAEKLKINSRVRAMVDSSLGKSGTIAADKIRLASVPTEEANYRSFAVAVGGHTVRLMVIQPLGIWREYVSVEVDGEQAYLCVVESGEDLWPWIYRGIGLWEHLLDQTEYLVARKRERREIDSRFGNLKEEK